MSWKYESSEFSEELKRRVNESKEYREKAKGMNWKTLIIISDVPFAVYSDCVDGELAERKHVSGKQIAEYRQKANFTIEIPTYDLSLEMFKGKKPLQTLFLTGAIKLDGSIFDALRYRDALEAWLKILADLMTESAVPSKEEFTMTLRERGLT